VLHELRRNLSGRTFDDLMERFGAEYAGKETTVGEFRAFLQKAVPRGQTERFFTYWLDQKGLPALHLADPRCQMQVVDGVKQYVVMGTIRRADKLPRSVVEVTVETDQGEVSKEVTLDGPEVRFQVATHRTVPPRRVIVDKYGLTAKAQGGVYTVLSFQAELEQTLIVYGTADEATSQREAAEALQRAIRERWSNYTVSVKSDREVTDEELKSHHLLLIGRPDSNRLVERFRAALPVRFGKRSFVVRGETYAHPDSALMIAAENPLNGRYSVVVLAGLSAEATFRTAPDLMRSGRSAEVVLLANGAKAQALIVPPAELVHEFHGQPGS
jgi:hypothetical protein